MRDPVQQLATLVLLRNRDVERRRCEVAEAAQAVALAEQALRNALTGRDAARTRLAGSLEARLKAPADPQIHLFCRRCEMRVGEAIDQVRGAELASHQAQDMAAAARRALTRAQVRLDALELQLRRAQRKRREKAERRIQEDAPIMGMYRRGALKWA